MKKIWEAPELETIGMNMTAHGKNNEGSDGFYTDSNGALVMGMASGVSTDDVIEGEITGPYTPVLIP